MKKCNLIFRILVCLLFSTSFLFFSCSHDTNQNETQVDALTATTLLARGNDTLPANPDNPYDYVGQLHNDLLYSYYQAAQQPRDFLSVMERLDSIAWHHVDFVNLAVNGYSPPDTVKVASILKHQITCATEVITRTGLSVSAKSSLSTFISSVLAFSTSEDDYEVIYSYIVAYELDVLLATSLSPKEKEVLLSLSSIARYSVHAKKKRPRKNMDPDWDVLISNIIASTEGASESQATAVMYGLVAGIVENSK